MVVGEMPEAVDLLVVGGGPGGYVAALEAARLGRQVVLVDAAGDAGLGGVCLHVGCIPSKMLIELAGHVHESSAWHQRGAPPMGDGTVDLTLFQNWKDEVVGGLSRSVRDLLDAAGVDVRPGRFCFTRPDQGALVTDPELPPTHLQFTSCILATGSRPTELGALPFDGERILSSTDVLALTDLPRSVAVVGGGAIGLELGTALAKLGSHVTIVEAQSSLLSTMGASVGGVVARRARQLGMDVVTDARVTGDDGSTLRLQAPSGDVDLQVERVVVAVGRTPCTDDLGLEALHVRPDASGQLAVGPDLLITPRVAAIGDITPGPALAHRASAQAAVAAAVLSGQAATFDLAALPSVVFSDPEVAVAGHTVESAAAAGLSTTRAASPVSASGRARTIGARLGSVEHVYDAETGIVVGATVVGPHASELIAEAVLAIEMAAHADDLAGSVHAHPTLAEMHHEAALVALDRPVHVPARRRADSPAGALHV